MISYTLALTGSTPFAGLGIAAEVGSVVTTTESIYTPTIDLPNGVYTWTVKAHDANGNASDWVTPQSFGVEAFKYIYLPVVLRQYP